MQKYFSIKQNRDRHNNKMIENRKAKKEKERETFKPLFQKYENLGKDKFLRWFERKKYRMQREEEAEIEKRRKIEEEVRRKVEEEYRREKEEESEEESDEEEEEKRISGDNKCLC
jgi:hypothetical protein